MPRLSPSAKRWRYRPYHESEAEEQLLLHREAQDVTRTASVKFPLGNMKRFRNAAGPQIRKLRTQQNLSQDALAAKLQLAGLDLDRISVAKIEMQIRSVFDFELAVIADVLQVTTDDLRMPRVRFKTLLPALIAGKK